MPMKPQLDILPDAQKELWPLLREIPQDFVLYGGTAVALRYGHRVSVDFDFFSSHKDTRIIDTTSNLDFIKKYAINYATPPFLAAESGSQIIYKLKMGNDKEVEITFLRDTEFIKGAVNKPSISEDNNIKIASPLDLMATKIIALISRKSIKDFVDICTLIQNNISLKNGIAAAIA